MRISEIFILLSISAFFSCTGVQLPVVMVETSAGNIELEIDTINAPVTTNNFLHLVDRGVYQNSLFYRTVKPTNQSHNKIKIEVIQGGLFVDSLIDQHKPILHETTAQTGIRHLDGTISMARNQPGTASTEFFICLGNQPSLDFGGQRNSDGQGFAAFGKVKHGMEVVRKIQQLPDSGQYLVNTVLISSIRRK